MDKTELSQIKHLSKEIALLKEQIQYTEYIADERMITDTVKGSSPNHPYTYHSIKIHGVDISGYGKEVKRLKNRLKRRIEELLEKTEEANKYVESIPDSEIRMILSLRYINGLSWHQIAAHMGMEGDGSTERKKHDRFMKFSRNS